MKNILYISYDGMTDPLGQSQVLPYIDGLSQLGYQFTILSFEKQSRYARSREKIAVWCQQRNIDWKPLPFSTRPPVLAKVWDVLRMKRTTLQLHKEKKFDLVHCRSYVSAAAGLQLKKQQNVKFLFDMRGFWVDERVDGGLWDMKNLFYRMVYQFYKAREIEYLNGADFIISLTRAASNEINTWPSFRKVPISIIPTSTDFNFFQQVTSAEKETARTKLGIPNESLVLSYLGSLGTWYLMDDMLRFFGHVKKKFPTAVFLIVTPDIDAPIHKRASQWGLIPSDILVRSAEREEVRGLIGASDLTVMFIKNSYSKIASSPTKLGEMLAMGIPVICNAIGDMKEILDNTEGGVVLKDLSDQQMAIGVEAIPSLLALDRDKFRKKAQQYYDLGLAVRNYASVYSQLLSQADAHI